MMQAARNVFLQDRGSNQAAVFVVLTADFRSAVTVFIFKSASNITFRADRHNSVFSFYLLAGTFRSVQHNPKVTARNVVIVRLNHQAGLPGRPPALSVVFVISLFCCRAATSQIY